MEIIENIRTMQKKADALRREGKIISFVPTMGYLHEGHLSLMREGRKRGDTLVISIFVNPTQFGPKEDLSSYPRDLARDAAMARDVGVDILFTVTDDAMYPEGYQTYVTVEEVTRGLCGARRSTHFRGVTTVVSKLFNIVKPHVAIFGMKDYQQLVTLDRMTCDLNFDIDIVGLPIVREPDGLAMSSRNTYLSADERSAALRINTTLAEVRRLFAQGETSAPRLIGRINDAFAAAPAMAVDYVEICDARTLEPVERVDREALVAVAVGVGSTRLIDNCLLVPGTGEEDGEDAGAALWS